MGTKRDDFPVGWERLTGVDEHSHSFVSSIAFDGARIHAASIYCSDGRVGEQIDEFLHERLRLPRYDRLAMPGGPACYAGGLWEGHSAERQLDFLCRVHGLERVVLIAHQDCAFYLDWMKVPPAELEQRQLDDVKRAADRIRLAQPNLTIESYFLRRNGTQMWFDVIEA
jgi:hypothetical protein